MDYNLFRIVGAVAGIGGIALASVVYIFREVIRKEVFPQLTKEQAYGLLNRIVVLVFIIGVLGIIAYVLLNLVEKTPLPRTFTGRVFNENTNERIRDAQVRLESEGPASLDTTDSEGIVHFALTDPNKEIRLFVKANGFEPIDDFRVIPAKNPGTQPIPLRPKAETVSQLWGYVRDHNDKPIQGAKVWLDDFKNIPPVETASDGSFWLVDIPIKSGEQVRVRCAKEGYHPNPCVRDMQIDSKGSHVIHLMPHAGSSKLPC